jgi:hypothetical protein
MYLFRYRLQAHSELEITILGKVLRTTQGSKECGTQNGRCGYPEADHCSSPILKMRRALPLNDNK